MPLTRGTRRYPVLAGAEATAVAYLLRATFDAADQGYADAQVLDTVAEGVQDGQLTVVDIDANASLEILGNKLHAVFSTTFAWNKLGVYSRAITKSLATTAIVTFNRTNATEGHILGWQNGAIINQASNVYRFHQGNAGTNRLETISPASSIVVVGSLSSGTDYTLAIVLGGYDSGGLAWRSGEGKSSYLYGAAFFIKGGAFTNWTLLWRATDNNTGTLYVGVNHRKNTADYDDLRVPDADLSDVLQPAALSTFTAANGTSLDAITPEVGGAWTEQSGNWDIQSNKANTDGAAIATVDPSVADALVDCIVNGGTADQPAIVLRLSDTSNYWYLQADRANNQLELHEYNATVDTVRASAAVTINNSTDYDLRAIADGATIDGFLDAGNKISYGSATLNQTTTAHGIRAENTAGQFDNFTIFPRTSTTYDSVLNGV